MKKNVYSLLIATTVLGTTGGTLVQAAENTATEVPTTAKVEFTVDSEAITPPVDPENPTEPVDPGEGGEGGEGGKGPLRIDWAPNFEFGLHELQRTTKGLTLPVIRSTGQTAPHYVQVSDLRGLDNGNWQLNVNADALTNGKHIIEGATISFVGQSAKDENMKPIAPENAPVWGENVIKLGSADNAILSAKGDASMGTWAMAMSKSENVAEDKTDTNINLNIPQGAAKIIKKGKYSSTLNWNLTSAVEASEKNGTGFMVPTTK